MSSFGGLYVGVSGLNVSQTALNITSHNLANVDTKGFVRQQAVITDFRYVKLGMNHISTLQQGLGADFATVRQVRDLFLDRAYRQEIGRQAYYEAQYQAVSEVEGLFGELEGITFQSSLNEFWVSLQELAKEPDSIAARASLIQNAVTLVERTENISNALNDYQINLNTQIQKQVNRINEIGDSIKELNTKIRMYESNKQEKANDLRDQRNLLLDELGKMALISYKEDASGVVNVSIEGTPFVSDEVVYHMKTERLNEASPMLKPVWEAHGNMDVFNLDNVPTSDGNTDIGSLKGLLIARGNKQGKYTDIASYDEIKNASTIMAVQIQFDQLIHGIVTTINDILCPNKKVTLADGSGEEIYILDKNKAPVGLNGVAGEALFNRKTVSRYEERDISYIDENGDVISDTVLVFIEENPADKYSLYTLGELEVNPVLLQNNAYLPLSSNTGSGDFDIKIAEELVTKWQEPFATLTPNDLTKFNFGDYYTAFISEIANRGEQYNTISTTQASMVETIDNQRSQITGVSSDEELTNLIKYQHAYNASARYINVVSEMLEHIIMRL